MKRLASETLVPVRGQVAERSKAPDLKSGVPTSGPGVRIPPCPGERLVRNHERRWLVRTEKSCIEWTRPEAWPRRRVCGDVRAPISNSCVVRPAGWDLEGAGRPYPDRRRTLGLRISGVGWRADWTKEARLRLVVGRVAEPELEIPEGVEVNLEDKGRLVRVRGKSSRVSAWAAELINKRPWNPYTGHGIFPDGWVGPRRSGKGR